MEIYIILTDTGTLLSKMIGVYTKYPLNHTSVSFEKNLQTVYSFGRKKPHNPFIGGFVKENLQDAFFKGAYCEIYSCSITPIQYELMQSYINQIEEEQKKYKYNLLGLLGIPLNKNIKRKNALFCSQFVAATFNYGGISIVNKPANFTMPRDFAETTNLNLLYAGLLRGYLANSPENSSEINVRGQAINTACSLQWDERPFSLTL